MQQKVLRTLEQRTSPHCSRSGAWYVGGLALGLALVLGSGALEIALAYGLTSDLSYIWAGPHAALIGYDPYDSGAWARAVIAFRTQTGGPPVYSYPPNVLLMLLPLGALPLPIVFVAWLVVPFALAAVALRALLARALPRDRLVHATAGLALVVSQPATVTMRTGQWSYLLLAALAAAVVLARRRPVGTAAAAWVLTVKAHLVVVALPALGAAIPAASRTRALTTFAALAVLPVAATAIARPSWWPSWWSVVPGSRAAEPHVTTAWRVLGDAFGPSGVVLAAVMAFLSVALVVLLRADAEALVAMGIAASLAFAPYMRSYDHLLLIVPIVLAARVARRRGHRAATLVGAGGLAAFIVATWTMIDLVGEARGSESLSWVVPFGTLVLVGAVAGATRAGALRPGRAPVSPPP